MVQQDITIIETATTKDGELYTEVSALFDEKEEFLNKEITQVTIKEAKENLLKKQTEIETLKREYSKKINASVAEGNVQLLQKKIVLASNKLEIQTEINDLFSSIELAIKGQIVYTSNRNGMINVYPVPSHWQIGAEVANNPEKVRTLAQDIMDNVRVVTVDVGKPRDVLSLIKIQK